MPLFLPNDISAFRFFPQNWLNLILLKIQVISHFNSLMGLIQDELSEVKKLAEHLISGCRLVSCVQTMVRAEIKQTPYKTIVICMQFPQDYPEKPLLIELKSKTLSEKLLNGLTNVCENEAKKHLKKPQVLAVLKFVHQFIHENPLSCCYDEINNIKKSLVDSQDYLKLKQKESCILLKAINGNYYIQSRIEVPNNYPDLAVNIIDANSNFPPTFLRHILGQSREIARKCVEPPLKKLKPNEQPFKPKPSLQETVSFLINCVKRLPSEKCQLCNELCFPSNPKDLVIDELSPKHIERLYCSHLFHQECLLKYLRTPPFMKKACQSCGQKVYHHKWGLSDRLAETRWAHEQARERELAEVADFFK